MKSYMNFSGKIEEVYSYNFSLSAEKIDPQFKQIQLGYIKWGNIQMNNHRLFASILGVFFYLNADNKSAKTMPWTMAFLD